MKQSILFALLLLCGSVNFAQAETPKKTIKNAKIIFKLAKDGYDNLKPLLLVKAAKTLMDNPQIGNFYHNEVMDQYEPNENEAILEQKDFFNAAQLLIDAKKMTAFDDKRTHRKIQKLEKRMSKYQKMGQAYNEIKVKNYLIYGKNSKTIATTFNKSKRVTLSVRVGDQLRLFVINNLKKQIGKSRNIGDAQLIKFTAQANGNYSITIENTSEEPNDCFLMIETK